MYADYSYYTQTFYGSVIPDEFSFNTQALRADAYINKLTFGRITQVTDEVKCAACAVAEIYYKFGKNGFIASENNDGYSVSYITDEHSRDRQLCDAAKLFLPSELIYSGID